MEIELINADGITLKTKGKYCSEDIDITPKLQTKTTTVNGKVTSDNGYVGLREVTVNVQTAPTLQSKTVTPTKSQQSVKSDSGYDGLSEVIVNAIPDEYISPSGSLNITENGTYDIKAKANVVVNVESEKPTLNAPTISLSNSTLTITNPATNGNFVTSYRVFNGSAELAVVTSKTVDLSTLLTDSGTYSITVKASAPNFNNSAASNSVSYEVAANGYSLSITEDGFGGSAKITYGDGTSNRVGGGDYSNVVSIDSIDYNENQDRSYTITDSEGNTHDYPYTLTSNTLMTIYSWNCLTGDMLITLADGSQKRIDEITLDDKVLSYNPETMQLGEDTITYCDSDKVKTDSKYDIWTFSDGTIVKTVHRHRLYNVERQAMTYMDEWKIGEHAINIDGAEIELVSHEVIKEKVRHFTIFTENQNYFVNGLLSGNRHTKKMNLPK